VINCEDVVIDLGSRTVSKSSEEVRLSPTEYVLLAELARNAGTLMDQRRLLSRVWGPSYVGDRAYLRTFIQRLRRKLEADPSAPTIIVTVGRQGYRFGPMQEIHPPKP
jgi:two-component system KDP operon response regulator KdpE